MGRGQRLWFYAGLGVRQPLAEIRRIPILWENLRMSCRT